MEATTLHQSSKGINLFADERSRLYWANLYAAAFIVINQGGTSSGKSEAIIRVMFALAILRGRSRLLVATDTIPNIKADALRIAEAVIQHPDIKPFIVSYHKTDRIITFTNGSVMDFKGFESEENAKGPKYHYTYVTEATRLSYAIWYQLYLRTKLRMFVDYNPTDTFYIHTNVIGNKKEFHSILVMRSDHRDNPYLTDDEHQKIEKISDPDTWRVYARGFTGKLKGTVFKWQEMDVPFWYTDGVIWAVDWGFSEKKTADPVACLRIMKGPPDLPGIDYLIDEIAYDRAIAPANLATIMKTVGYKEGQPCYCDHSNESIYELILSGITGAMPAIKGPGSIRSGILFLGRKNIAYTKRSYNIREELKHYKYMEIEGIVTNTPVDEWNHLMDAGRYGVHSHALVTANMQ